MLHLVRQPSHHGYAVPCLVINYTRVVKTKTWSAWVQFFRVPVSDVDQKIGFVVALREELPVNLIVIES